MTSEPKTFLVSAVVSPSGTLRMSLSLVNQFSGSEIVQGRARVPEGNEFPVLLNVPNRTLDGLQDWLRSLNNEHHSFCITLHNHDPLSIAIEPSVEPVVPEGVSDKPLTRPVEGLYLGRKLEDNFNELVATQTAFALDESDLLTHVFICGVTGMGKTVLGKAILEEAAMKGIPSIAIDLKGDISSLALMMTGEDEEEILPFVQPGRNTTAEETAAVEAALHRKNLEKWGLTREYVEEAKRKICVNIFTPRSNDGFRLALSAFPEPPENFSEMRDSDPDEYDDLLEFLTKRFVARLTLNRKRAEKAEGYLFEILKTCFRDEIPMHEYDGVKRVLDEFSSPSMGIDQIGGLETEEYISSKDRENLANAVNALLTGTGTKMFEGWPVSIDGLVSREEAGQKTPVCVINLSHLEFEEQAYVVGYLAYLISFWMRRLSGTYESRLLFYIDEIGGGGGKRAFFPSVAVSPCKPALNYLLRQGRAFGVSCIFATQNPGDIDYKGLSNCGTWMVGCLRTKLDQNKIAQGAGDAELEFESAKRFLPSLSAGQFLVKTPGKSWSIIQERWLLSLHRPLAATELKKLKAKYEKEAGLLMEKAKDLRNRQRRSNTINLLRQTIAEYPYASVIAGAYLLLARVLLDDGKYADAKNELKQVLKRWITDDELAEAKFLLGSCDEKDGSFASAAESFEEAQRISTDTEFKEQARVHAEYCGARNAWPKLGLGERFIWWISGRKREDGELWELQVKDNEILTRTHQMRLDKIDWSLPPAIDYEVLAKARSSSQDELVELNAEAVRIKSWAEKQAIKMFNMRLAGDLDGAAILAKRIIQRLLEAALPASDSVIAEIRLSSEAVEARRADLKSSMTQVEARQFEYDIAWLLQNMDYQTDVTRATGDDGVDVFARRDDEKIVIQCKKWRNKVIGRSVIDELGGTAKRNDATRAILATTSSFSADARRAAKKLDIVLWDFDELCRLFRKHFGRPLEA